MNEFLSPWSLGGLLGVLYLLIGLVISQLIAKQDNSGPPNGGVWRVTLVVGWLFLWFPMLTISAIFLLSLEEHSDDY